MIQVEIIEARKEKKFIEDLNYFLERLLTHQLIDIKYQVSMFENNVIYTALIIYKVE